MTNRLRTRGSPGALKNRSCGHLSSISGLALSQHQCLTKCPLCATSGRPKNYHFEISSFRDLRSAAAVLPIGDLTLETVQMKGISATGRELPIEQALVARSFHFTHVEWSTAGILASARQGERQRWRRQSPDNYAAARSRKRTARRTCGCRSGRIRRRLRGRTESGCREAPPSSPDRDRISTSISS